MIRLLGRLTARLRRRSPRRTRPALDAREVLDREAAPPSPESRGGSKPYTRWWWLAGPFRREDIRGQLEWLRANGFGGVELAWLWPTWLHSRSRRPTGWGSAATSPSAAAGRSAARPSGPTTRGGRSTASPGSGSSARGRTPTGGLPTS